MTITDIPPETRDMVSLVCLVISLSYVSLLLIKNVSLVFYNWRQYTDNFQSYVEAASLVVTITFLMLNFTVGLERSVRNVFISLLLKRAIIILIVYA